MIIQASFGSAQASLGYQFYGVTGTLIGSRVTAGIVTLPETGAYLADATVPTGAVGVFWDSATSEVTEDLREALASETAGDPWLTVIPASYADGTAGAALGRLNNTPAASPIAIAPLPDDDPDLCVVYLDTESMTGTALTGLTIVISLASTKPALSTSSRVVSGAEVTMTNDTENPGRYTATLEKGLSYKAANRDLWSAAHAFTLADEETFNIATA